MMAIMSSYIEPDLHINGSVYHFFFFPSVIETD